MVNSLSILCILVSALISRSGVQGQAPVCSGRPCSRKTVWPAEGDGCAEEMSCPCSTCLPPAQWPPAWAYITQTHREIRPGASGTGDGCLGLVYSSFAQSVIRS